MADEKKRAPPADEYQDRSGDLDATARLLFEVFGAPRFRDARYLDWFYRQNPEGRAIETDFADAQGRLGHIGGIPGVYHCSASETRTTFPLNVAVAERARGKGALGRVTKAHWKEAFERFDHALALGMANANSVHYFEKHDGYRVVGKLPVCVCPPLWPTLEKVTTHAVSKEFLRSAAFDALYDSLDVAPTQGWAIRWTPDVLRWRLSTPDAGYAVHVGKDAAVVSRSDVRKGIPFTIIMKTFRLKSARGRVASANGAVAAACRFRRSPAAAYAGWNRWVRVYGVPLPEKLKPAPLYLCVKGMHPEDIDKDSFEYDVWEFMDFDVY